MREYKRYDEYKDSGVEYLKTIPKNWSKMKIKYIAKNNLESFIDGDWIESPYIQDEGIRLIQTGNIGNGRYIEKGDRYISEDTFIKLGCTEIFPNDILICRLAEPVGRACLAPQLNNRMITSVDVCRLTPKDKYLKKFIIYYMQMYKYLDYIESLARGSTRQRISRSQLGEVYITIPSKQEQQKIASFLNKKTAEIDYIINKKETLIEHLEKYKKSVIAEAVTKGKFGDKYINEDGKLIDEIEMKDSGVEWVGEIPSSWNVIELKYFTKKVGSGKTPRGGSEIYLDKGIKFLRSQNVYNNGLNLEDVVHISEEINLEMKNTEVKPRDLLLNITGASIGRCSIVPKKMGRANVNQHVCIIRLVDNVVNNEFIHYQVISKIIQCQIMAHQTGSSREGLNFEQVKNLKIIIPNNLVVQKSIASKLNDMFSNLNKTINKIISSIEKYKEYKKSLIFEAVTGKIDLRDYELEGGEELAEHKNTSPTDRERVSAAN